MYMTGYSGESTVVDTPNAVLQKPFTPEALAHKVRDTLGARIASKSILVADDDPEIRGLIRSALESEGYKVHAVGNGKEAIAVLKQTPVSLILTDLAMPELDGIETIGEIRKDYPDLKIIAMSGKFAGSVLNAARFLGANAILSKPLDVDELLKNVRRFL